MADGKKERRPSWERREIQQIKEELGITKHTEAVRIFKERKAQREFDEHMNSVKKHA